ncbi:hypothetical protein Hbl1158_08700 [Halobaculum sp. CBA1158]|uniref:hypothetical protein n=1 Tax=Halobaculum sp. CBA1158 TaxID=2904243 RepID=UPI001F33CB0F|nr:hypothetical protein [Halobaculum sp. CBA1158]UIO98635.1 hypothetical protein Hbl1158_08700 [Halobaculum sp. CBA1158]
MERTSFRKRIASTKPAAAVSRHPRAVLTLCMLVVLLLAGDTAAAESTDFLVEPEGTTRTNDGP